MLAAGELEGEQSQTGRWSIPRRVVNAILEQYPCSDTTGVVNVGTQKRAGLAEASESVQELMERVEALSYELGASQSSLEFTEKAESSLREERDRIAEELEREREERRRLSEELQRRSERFEPTVSRYSVL